MHSNAVPTRLGTPPSVQDEVASVRDAVGECPVKRILAGVKDIAVLPQVVYKIVESTGSTTSSAADIEKQILVDPGFSAKVLTLANSAFVALPRKVTSIKDAIMFLGYKQVRQLAMTAGVFDLFVGKTDRESLRRRAWWRHSLDTAVCAKWLSSRCREVDQEEAYTAGLLHYIGKTILDRHDPIAYEKVIQAMDQGVPDVHAERHFFGCDHVAVTLAVSTQWGFPDTLVAGLNYLEPAEGDDPFFALRACVGLADSIARKVVQGTLGTGSHEAREFPMWSLMRLGISGEDISKVIDAAAAVIAAARN